MTSDKPGEFDECGCPSHVDQNGRRTVNPKCEHLRAWLEPVANGLRCSNCGKMFLPVPEDLLREAAKTLRAQTEIVEFWCGDSATDINGAVPSLLRRIDEVLGK